MLFDLRESPADDSAAALRGADVCILGGGIAGLTLADRLSSAGVRVLLLEAGGERPAGELAQVELADDPHLGSREGRVQALGGCSLTWGGQLLPLPMDARWPVTTGELAPFAEQAENLLGVDALPYAAEGFFAKRREPMPALAHGIEGTTASFSKFAPFHRRNLAAWLRRRLAARPSMTIALHAPVTELLLAEDRQSVAAVRVSGPTGAGMLVRARRFVVACGTVESLRLLLASGIRRDEPDSPLGRGFCDHLTAEVACFNGFARERLVRELRPWVVGGARGTVHGLKLFAGRELCHRLGLQGALAHVVFEEPEHTGSAGLRRWLRQRQAIEDSGTTSGFWPGVVAAGRQGIAATLERRRWISPEARVSLHINVVQRPEPASCIRLSDRRDQRGMPLAVVDWRIAPADLAGLRAFARHLRDQLATLGFTAHTGAHWRSDLDLGGELLPGLDDARHAMGGAAMGRDARSSVVDPQLQVHGLSNLSVASAAVFPDGAPQLPTLTLMALSLRLAGYLRRQLQP